MTKHAACIALIAIASFASGCSRSCERIEDEIQEIGREIRQNPGSAMERQQELETLRDELASKGCLG